MDRTNEELTRLSDLIGLIYEGATDPARWTCDILPAVLDYRQMYGVVGSLLEMKKATGWSPFLICGLSPIVTL